MPHRQNLLFGIGAALSAAFFLSCLNVFAKILVEEFDPIIVTFWRNVVALSLLLIGFILFKKTALMKTKKLKSQVFRAVIGTIGMTMAVWTFQYLPVTEGVVISFTSPFIVLLLSYPLLKEKVGPYRVAATIIGLIGVILMIGFDTSVLTPKGLMIAFTWAFSNALVLLMLRQLGKTEHAMTTTFYFLFIGLFLTSLYLPFADSVLPQNNSLWWPISGIGIIGLLSLILKTESFRHAPASVIAPVAYTILIWTAILDFLIWNRVADINIWIGAAIIIASNMIIIWREQKKSIGPKRDETPLSV